jgi:tRNA dimethylallyltransferase
VIDPHHPFAQALVIAGPTAIGKTEVALELARHFPGEIVSADSRQIYRYMSIGTAKPTPEQLGQVPHHFIDIRNPDEFYTAGEYGRAARHVVLDVMQRRKLPIIVGGSGFYLQALLEGFSASLPSDLALREQLKRRVQSEGGPALHAELAKVDPQTAVRLHPNDTHRIVRALEVYHLTGMAISALQRQEAEPAPFDYRIFCLSMARPQLYQRINQRVERMLEQGLIEECRRLLELGYSRDLNALQTVGYQEVFQFLAGEISRETMRELIQRHTRQYAKRQLTWFRKMARRDWILIEKTQTTAEIAAKIMNLFHKLLTSD